MGANSVPIHSHNSSHINSVFDRIEWPEISAKSSLNAQQNSSASHRRNPSSAQSAGALRDQRIVRFQNSNRQPKDKGLLLEEPNKENESLCLLFHALFVLLQMDPGPPVRVGSLASPVVASTILRPTVGPDGENCHLA
jgi:hypothetical protein